MKRYIFPREKSQVDKWKEKNNDFPFLGEELNNKT